MTDRLPPLEPPYDTATTAALRRLMGGADDVPPLTLFRTIAHHPALLDRFRQIGSTVLSFGTLEARDRELLIHRTTARCDAAYEWGVHATLFASPLGLGEDWLTATWSGTAEDAAFATGNDALLIRTADALHDAGALPDRLYAELAATYSDGQLVELVCLCGFYHLVSFACGAFALAPEPWAATPPTRERPPSL